MHIDALSILCLQLTCDLLAIAKLFVIANLHVILNYILCKNHGTLLHCGHSVALQQ